MITLDTVVAAAIHDRTILMKLGPRLREDLVLANPFLRRIVSFADDFNTQHRTLPSGGDWELWLGSLDAGMTRDGTREALGRLLAVDLSTLQPAYLVEKASEQIERAAVQVARARLNALPDLQPEAFLQLATQVERVRRNGARPVEQWPTLATLMQDKDLVREPEELVPRLVWRGTLTILAGPAFSGKSTLASQGVAALSHAAPFLDGRHPGPGSGLWCNVADEPLARTVQRLTTFGANDKSVRIYDFRHHSAKDLRSALVRAVEEFEADVAVIDSLIAWARRTSRQTPGSGDAAAWAEVMRPLSELAHEHDVGLLVLHHTNRDGHYRDSTEIAAAADVLIEMQAPRVGSDPTLRRFVTESRLDGRTGWTATYAAGCYEFGTGVPVATPDRQVPPGATRTLEALIPAGASWTQWLTACGRPSSTFDRHVKALQQAKFIVLGDDGRYRRTPEMQAEEPATSSQDPDVPAAAHH